MKVHCHGAPELAIETPGRAVMLRRDRFEKALAHAAVSAGARLFLQTSVTGLCRGSGNCYGIVTEYGEVEGSLIIGADGCESKVGQWAAITRSLRPAEAFTSVQYRMQSDFCNDGYLHFFSGEEVVPRGYIWIFPKGNRRVLVGAGLYGCFPYAPRASIILDKFIQNNMPGATVEERITGCVPLAICPKTLFRENVVLIGDAARQANPLTAGCIMNTLEAADCLVKELLKRGETNGYRRLFSAYCRTWSKQRFNQRVFGVIKEIFIVLTDEQCARVVGAMQKNTIDRFTGNRPFSFSFPLVLRLFTAVGPILGRSLLRRVRRHFFG
jgi:digeranylgeranylglycerophospholipid reductase